MNIMKFFGTCLGFRQRRLNHLLLERIRLRQIRIREKRREEQEIIARFHSYPIKKMSSEEFFHLQWFWEIDINSCKLGTLFVFPSKGLPQKMVIVGQVVEQKDLISNQWGMMSLPERGVNRYRLVLT